MARQFIAGTFDGLYRDAMPFGALGGMAISLWLYRIDNTEVSLLFEYDQSNGFDYVTTAGSPGDNIRSYFTGGGWSDRNANHPATGAWHHYYFVIPGTGEGVPPPVPNEVWIDGVNQTLNTPSHTNTAGTWAATSPLTLMLRRIAGVNSRWLSGRLAEVAMWSSHTMVASPAQFVRQLCKGVNPMHVRKTEMVLYVPVLGADSPEPDLHGQQRKFTVAGAPTRVPHPPTCRGMVNFQD